MAETNALDGKPVALIGFQDLKDINRFEPTPTSCSLDFRVYDTFQAHTSKINVIKKTRLLACDTCDTKSL